MNEQKEKYFDTLTIVLHWVMALVIFGLFGLGLYMVDLSYYDAWYKGSTALHKSVGLLLFMLLIIRIVWRLKCERINQAVTFRSGPKSWDEILASLVQTAMYIFIAFLCFSGYFISTAGGRDVDFFSLFSLPPMPIEIENQEDLAGTWHFYLAWGLMALVALHAMGALKHHFIDRDKVLLNMIKPSKKISGDN